MRLNRLARRMTQRAKRRREWEQMWDDFYAKGRRERKGVVTVDEATKKKLAELKRRAERAVSRAKQREALLFRFGQPVHDEERHKLLLREIRAERNRVLAEVRREAAKINAEQRQRVDAAQHFARDGVLDGSERREVSERLPFLRSEIGRMSVPDIAARLSYVTGSGSKVEQFATWSAVMERREQIVEKRGGGITGLDVELRRLDAVLFDEHFDELVSEPTEVVNEAMQLEEFCYTRSHDAETLAGAYLSESRRHIREFAERQRYARGGRPLETPPSVPGPKEVPAH